MKKRKRKFRVCFIAPIASILEFDPSFDRIPSSGEYVDTLKGAIRYYNEVCGVKNGGAFGVILNNKRGK